MTNETKPPPSLTGPIVLMWLGFCAPVIIWIPGFFWGLSMVNRGADKTVFAWNAGISFGLYALIIMAVLAAE